MMLFENVPTSILLKALAGQHLWYAWGDRKKWQITRCRIDTRLTTLLRYQRQGRLYYGDGVWEEDRQ